jgi:sulfonate dioxygenase
LNLQYSETIYIMAPALVEQVVEQQTVVGYKSGVGQYKEAAFGGPKVFRKDLELRGTDKHAPARYPNYLPVWDNETEK